MPLQPSTCSAPGKLILFGEHSVVYGTTAIAASLSSLRIRVDVQTNHHHLTINLKAFSFSCSLNVTDLLPAANAATGTTGNVEPNVVKQLRPVLLKLTRRAHSNVAKSLEALLYLFVQIVLVPNDESLPPTGAHIKVESLGLPVGAGLGSSAAFSVAAASALLESVHGRDSQTSEVVLDGTKVQRPGEERLTSINEWAFMSETLLHGTPSGLDNTTSTFGGAIVYVREPKSIRRLETFPQLQLMLINTLVPRETSKLVGNVRKLRERHPNVVNAVFATMQSVADDVLDGIAAWLEREGEEIISGSSSSSSDKDLCTRMDSLIRVNQGLLASIGVSHPALDAICNVSNKFGYAAKLTGAGGGGCAFALLGVGNHTVATTEKKLKSELLSDAYNFTVQVGVAGGVGVASH
jgi:mevalonate kinase